MNSYKLVHFKGWNRWEQQKCNWRTRFLVLNEIYKISLYIKYQRVWGYTNPYKTIKPNFLILFEICFSFLENKKPFLKANFALFLMMSLIWCLDVDFFLSRNVLWIWSQKHYQSICLHWYPLFRWFRNILRHFKKYMYLVFI